MSKQLRIWLFVLLGTLITSTSLLAEGVITMTTSKAVGERIKLYIRANGSVSINGALEAGQADEYGRKDYTIESQTITIRGEVTELNCSSNQLTSLDLSKNTTLTGLQCQGNQLTSLNVSSCTALTNLYCDENQLTSLNVSDCTSLTTLWCYSNQLTSLDLSKNTALTKLLCNSNQLTSLDVSKNTSLTELGCGINRLTSLDVSKNTALTELSCNDNQLTSLDVSKNTALTKFVCNENQLTNLDVSQNTALKTLGCGKNQLTSLNVSSCTALTELSCNDNQLTNLDVSKNTALTELVCDANQLTSLNVSTNTALTKLGCGSNRLTSLNVSNCTALTELWCHNNQLTILDVSKNTALTTLECGSNQLTNLDVSSCTALTQLGFGINQLTSLDLSKNTALTKLNCYSNQLTSLDLSKNTALTKLVCNSNQLTSLDVSVCTALTELYCNNNRLTSLDLSNCRGLETLTSYGNKFDNGAIHQLISSLPNRKGIGVGKFYVIDSDNNNTCYQYDVDLAKKKFWLLYHEAGALYLGEPNPTFALTYEPTISGGSIIIKGADDLQHVVYGTELTINATPAEGYELTALTANGTDILATRKVVVTEATEIKATFVKKTFVVTLDKVGEGELSTTGTDNLNKVPYGTELTIIATAAEGYELKSIVVDGVNITATKKVVIKNNVTVKATFVKKTFKVTLTKEGEGTITATGASNLNAVAYGTELTIVATPAAGYELQSLVIDGVVNITATKKVVVTDNVTIKATFVDHTGVETTVTQQVKLYPNPATDYVIVEGVASASEVTLHSMTGERLYAGRADDRGTLQIDLTPYADGVYLVCVAGETYRVVVRR